MRRVKVIGLGSPFGEDRVGWLVLERLEIPHFDLEILDRPGPGLLEHFPGYSNVYLIDAVVSGAPPGTIHHLEDEAIASLDASLSSHSLGLGSSLELGRSLGLLPDKLIFYGIEINPLNQGPQWTAEVLQAIDKVVEMMQHSAASA